MQTESKEKIADCDTQQEKTPQTKEQLIWEIVRFRLVGGGATLCDYFIFWLLDGVLLPMFPLTGNFWPTLALWIATAGGFIVGMLVNWVLSITFVFRAVQNPDQAKSKKSFWIFVFISVIGLILTLVGVWALSAWLPAFSLFGRADLFGTAWNKWLAKAIMTCIVLVWNYWSRKVFIFK